MEKLTRRKKIAAEILDGLKEPDRCASQAIVEEGFAILDLIERGVLALEKLAGIKPPAQPERPLIVKRVGVSRS